MEFHELEELFQTVIDSCVQDADGDDLDTAVMAENIVLAIARKFGVTPDQRSMEAHTVVVARKVVR